MLMNVSLEYNDQAKFCKTCPDLLPEDDKTILGIMGINDPGFPAGVCWETLAIRTLWGFSGTTRNQQNPILESLGLM